MNADVPAVSTAAAGPSVSMARRQATPQSASPVAAWCTVTDRLRRLRADLEVGPHKSFPSNYFKSKSDPEFS